MQSSGVSFSEPECLSSLGQFPLTDPYPYYYPESYDQTRPEYHLPPIPRPPCLKGSLRRGKRPVSAADELTTSV